MRLPTILKSISKRLTKHGAKAIVVGGSVRDHFLKLPSKDYDIEVYGLNSLHELERILRDYGDVNLVGKSFGILKFTHNGVEYDFSFPRTETKVSSGHRGFSVKCSGDMNFRDASIRRDFTINAMGYDIEERKFLDPFGGRDDMKRGVLRHVNKNSFIEDPLRLYRAVQFGARFEYSLAGETKELCKSMVQNGLIRELPKERIYSEFKKLLLKSQKPSLGFEMMRELGVLEEYPELEVLIGVPQNARWHPEGDVWTHTLLTLDKMVEFKSGDEKGDLKLLFASLCHDFGKATHTQIGKDKISAIGHDRAGVKPTKNFLYRLTDEHKFIESIAKLVRYHMMPTQYFLNGAKNQTIRRLSTKVNLEELIKVARADFLGRKTEEAKSGTYEAGDWLAQKAQELNVYNKPPEPILYGRDLISLGLKPSKEFGTILNRVYQAQIVGEVSNYREALSYIRNNI